MGVGTGPATALMPGDAEELASLHLLRVAGLLVAPDNLAALVERGYVVASSVGALLTDLGHERHEQLLALERASIDMQQLLEDFKAFEQVDPAVKARIVALQMLSLDDRAGRDGQVCQLRELADQVIPALKRSARQLLRFGAYAPRLRTALDRFAADDATYLADPRVDSFHAVWMEAHQDYLVTLGDLCPEEERS